MSNKLGKKITSLMIYFILFLNIFGILNVSPIHDVYASSTTTADGTSGESVWGEFSCSVQAPGRVAKFEIIYKNRTFSYDFDDSVYRLAPVPLGTGPAPATRNVPELDGDFLPSDPSELTTEMVFQKDSDNSYKCRTISMIHVEWEHNVDDGTTQGRWEDRDKFIPTLGEITNLDTNETSTEPASGTVTERLDKVAGSDDSFSGFPAFVEVLCTHDFFDLLMDIYGYVVIFMVVALIIYGMTGFAKAIAASDEDALKKEIDRFKTRVIIVIAIALLPIIVDFLITIMFGPMGIESCLIR